VGAVEQADVAGTQFVDLLPALQGGGGPRALLQRRAPRPAGTVRRDFLPHGLAEAVPQVPAFAGLHRVRQRLAGRLAIGTRPVTRPPFCSPATSRRGTGRASANGASGATSIEAMPCHTHFLGRSSAHPAARGSGRSYRALIQGTTVTGHRAAFTSRTASEPTSRCPA
jgi:hypothetical protein